MSEHEHTGKHEMEAEAEEIAMTQREQAIELLTLAKRLIDDASAALEVAESDYYKRNAYWKQLTLAAEDKLAKARRLIST